jgi:hypothetical protein
MLRFAVGGGAAGRFGFGMARTERTREEIKRKEENMTDG